MSRALPWAATAARLLLAAVFAVAALTKIGDPASTVRAVRAYQVLPDGLATVVGRGLPAVELTLAVLLALGVALRVTGAVAAGLLTVFVAGIVSADARGLQIDCGCFGGGGVTAHPHYAGEIARDAALLLVAAALALVGRSRLAVGPRLQQVPDRGKRAAHQREVAQQRFAAVTRRTAVGSALLLLVSGALGVAVAQAGGPAPATRVPTGVTAAGGILVGSATAAHHVIAYEDPQCPICGEFEKSSGSVLAAAVAAGTVQVEYRMRSFLGPESVRADAALGAAQDEGRFEALREQLFAHQPEERTGGFTVKDLLRLGAAAGLTDSAYVDAVEHQTYAAWAREVDDRASRAGNTGTPQLLVDGKVLGNDVTFSATRLAAALAA